MRIPIFPLVRTCISCDRSQPFYNFYYRIGPMDRSGWHRRCVSCCRDQEVDANAAAEEAQQWRAAEEERRREEEFETGAAPQLEQWLVPAPVPHLGRRTRSGEERSPGTGASAGDKGGRFLALDLGAESGRGVVGRLQNGRLLLSEVHRFPNRPAALPDGLHWNLLGLFAEVQAAIGKAVQDDAGEGPLTGIGVDTWGVDYGLLDSRDELLGSPFHYRDHRTDHVMDRVFKKAPRERIFERTGIQFMQLNTLFQLAAEVERDSPPLKSARTLLFIPDLLHFWLSGEKACEYTIATTSQLFDPSANVWATDLMEELGVPPGIFLPVTPPATRLGTLRQTVRDETGAGEIPILLPGSHDTASAVAAVPAFGRDFIYISSGTWSLIGIELNAPRITPEALAANFTNEGGVANTIRFLKNVMGLWLVQECRRAWAREGTTYSYAELVSMAESEPPFAFFIDPDDPSFLAPYNMPLAIATSCERTGQSHPPTPGATIRTCLEGLAFAYRRSALRLEAIAGRPFPTIHVVGGGAQNRLLCQFTANATGKSVVAGPIEATAAGNILVQAMGCGEIGSLAEARQVVRASFHTDTYTPVDQDRWSAAYEQFLKITDASGQLQPV